MSKIRKRSLIFMALMLSMMLVVTSCGNADGNVGIDEDKQTIIFADAGWESIQFHNFVAGFILENGYGYPTDTLPGSTAATFAGFREGDIDVYMEIWTDNIMDIYQDALDKGEVIESAINFDDNAQGFYVPTWMIEGDEEKGLEPLVPDLERVDQLHEHWELFKDQEAPDKGRIYGSPPGWQVDTIMRAKMDAYELGENYNYFSPGSDTGLAASLGGAMEKDEPWVGYYWEPTWILGMYDMTLLKEDEYTEEKWEDNYSSQFPPTPVTVSIYKDLPEDAPELAEFFSHYETSSKVTSEALAFMQENDAEPEDAAIWFLEEYEDMWTSWVPEDVAEKVKEALN